MDLCLRPFRSQLEKYGDLHYHSRLFRIVRCRRWHVACREYLKWSFRARANGGSAD